MPTATTGGMESFLSLVMGLVIGRELGRGSGPPPYAAYETTVRYSPGNRQCVSQLVQLPSGWWQPVKRCERIVLVRQ